ncbi:GHMP kinase [Candidatus Chloroploca sp. Khr17]|uniref:GHMP family kinase ATP-binding protein n=1 Tax=Candidatus Chloroploca sp. Khr17 TaxID=2496869 RepID=UPI00101C97C1|nr:GHMP kinase [Candidatus Chloroploca sp. Khr17]
MIISRTPLRISFAGGGSDLAAFYRHEPGAVVSVSIDKYIYINANAKFDHQIRASYSVTEIVNSVEELQHELIREALKLTGRDQSIEITSISDIPSQGTGLGSSSTYTVGLLNALHAFCGRFASAERLAREACYIEIERCGAPIGKQDQYIAAYGGLQFIQFNPDESVFVDPVICSATTRVTLQNRLLMLYTGQTRQTATVLTEQRSKTEQDARQRANLRRLVQLAHDLRAVLVANDVDAFGEILHEGWMLKRQLASGISNDRIDAWYERGRAAGAMGGKILGAGGGGFLLLYAPVERHAAILAALPELRRVPIRFEPQGSKIIYVEEEL